ncbi:hypothetical protein [Legionella drancourtii]|uniref:Uncharacterized protein n=1 Tax=Legionella drancourtii LLAP12 TaxID=658187 RepID=G9EKP1_9GAMM|nr:hypothetical protein [Legionella drancourtii]EHL32174.1 hypothetical protein LDG_5778 [Legionella drancourtii LLAP12]
MLKKWQQKYPEIFAYYPNIMSELTTDAQNSLDAMLTYFMEKKQLNTTNTHFLLDLYLNEVDFVAIQNFLSKIVISGLNDALTLFSHSHFTYKKEHFNTFAILTSVLANPLCQIIFDARLRGFSDYSLLSEPLENYEIAHSIIQQLSKLNNQEEQVAVFFDFFTDYRPFPASQTYTVEIDIAMEVESELRAYCQAKIDTINNKHDYLRAKQLIEKINTKGGSIDLFNEIKYKVASAIENKDMCSARNYQQHMNAIHQVLMKHQFELDFEHKLQNFKGAQEMVTTQMQGHALFMPSSYKAPVSEMENNLVANSNH